MGCCTRCVALHPLWGAAPEQKGCSAYGSGVLLLVLRLLWWCVALRCGPMFPLGFRAVVHPLCSAAPIT